MATMVKFILMTITEKRRQADVKDITIPSITCLKS